MEELRRLAPDELERAWELEREAFRTPPERRARFLGLDPACFVGAFDGARLVGIAAAHPLRQYFGGRPVPVAAVHSVAVAPERRGRGLGGRLLAALCEAMRERGAALSTLFPATTRAYRSGGYELAGTTCWRRVAPRALERLPRPERASVRALAPDEIPALAACYAGVARTANGMLERDPDWWERLRDPLWAGSSLFAALGPDERIAGYLVYRQHDGEYTAMGGPFGLSVDEILWSGRDAGLALWGLLASWAPQVESILYRGTAEDPLLWLLPEQELELVAELRWMSRILDPVAAIAARGFADGVEVEVHLELADALLPESRGRFVLRVAKGRGELARGGRGELRLDAGALASLFTGYATPDALARAGRLDADSGAPRDALAAAFAGPTPWMLDQF